MNFQDWKKQNPRKTINDYYLDFPEKRHQTPVVRPTQPIITAPIIRPTKSTKKSRDYLLMIASIIIGTGFFLPWVNIELLNINLLHEGGADIPDLLKYVYKEGSEMQQFAKTIYLIPIAAFLVLIGEAANVFQLKALGEVVTVISSGIWFYTLYTLFNYAIQQHGLSVNIFDFFTTGIYLTLGGCLYYFFDIIRGFFD